MIPRLWSFIEAYKKRGGRVIYTTCVPWNERHLAKNIVRLYESPKARYFSADDSGFPEQFYGVRVQKGDFVITKNSYDAFTNPLLEKVLRKLGVEYLVMAGIFSDGCVHATIQGGFSRGYNFIILEDLTETSDKKIRQEIQDRLKKFTWPVMFGRTINSRDIWKEIKS